MLDHGYSIPRDPVLQPLDNIELRDAILAYDEDGNPVPAAWPEAEFIVGNPPFLGTKLLRWSLGDEYVDGVLVAWYTTVDRSSDLARYWHGLARRQIESGAASRAGLLATNSIVEVHLQVWLCNVHNPNGCRWKTLNESESRIRPGGGAGRRTTARILCSASAEIGYRSIIDVDLVGQSDPDDKVYKVANVRCRPLAWWA